MREATVTGSGNFKHLGFFTVHLNISTRASSILPLPKCGHHGRDLVPQPFGQQVNTIPIRPPWRVDGWHTQFFLFCNVWSASTHVLAACAQGGLLKRFAQICKVQQSEIKPIVRKLWWNGVAPLPRRCFSKWAAVKIRTLLPTEDRWTMCVPRSGAVAVVNFDWKH